MDYNYVPETAEQMAVFEWAKWQEGKYPELKLMYHVPNEGKRSVVTGARLRREGMKKGVSDICLPAARGEYHGLYIELKAKGGKATPAQVEFLQGITEQGYFGCICYGAEEAEKAILNYLKLPQYDLKLLIAAHGKDYRV